MRARLSVVRVSWSSPAHELGMKMPINHDGPGPVSDVCSQKDGWRPTVLRIEAGGDGITGNPLTRQVTFALKIGWGLVARHGCRQNTHG